MLLGRFALDGAAGARVRAALEYFARPHPTGTAEDGETQQVPVRDDRTRGQRLADA
jgi:hypothetical protein